MTSSRTVLFVAGGADAGWRGAIERSFEVVVVEGAVDAMKRLSTASDPPVCVVTHAAVTDLPLSVFLERARRAAPDAAMVVVGGLPAEAEAAEALVGVDAYVPPGRESSVGEHVVRAVGNREVDAAIDRHDRLTRCVASLAAAVADAPDREAIEAAVYDTLQEGDLYHQVWVARVDDDGNVEVSVPGVGSLGEWDVQDLADGGDPSFVSKAIERGEVVTAEGRAMTRSASAPPSPGALNDGGRARTLSAAAVPFVHGGRVSGLGLVTTGRPDAYDASERSLLADLGAVVGHAHSGVAGSEPGHGEEARGLETLVHELRNPLGIARAHLEIAREDEDFGSVELAESAVERAITTVNRVAEGVGGLGSAELVDVSIESAATTAWESVSSPEPSLDVSDTVTVRADRDMLVRLFENLFGNAVEHGGESVAVEVGALPGGFYVEDDGPGIPQDRRETVFQRGYSTAEDGLGIGLSIVETIAEAHGWALTLTEGASGGARLEVTGVERVPEGSVE